MGTFIYIKNIIFPFHFIRKIENWLKSELIKDIPCISIQGVYTIFKEECKKNNITNEIALYSCLRISNDNELIYPKIPYVYHNKKYKNRNEVPIKIENYILEYGEPISREELNKYAVDELYLKDYSLNQYLSSNPHIINYDRGYYIHIENLNINYHILNKIKDYISSKLRKQNKISINSIFKNKIVDCNFAGINNPYLLYNILKINSSNNIINFIRNPYIVKNTSNNNLILSTKKEIINYIKEKNDICTYEELNKVFVKEKGYTQGYIYILFNDFNVIKYLPSCIIHIDTLGITQKDILNITKLANKHYKDSINAGNFTGFINELIEDDELPKLKNNIYWTELLLSQILKRNNFIILGNKNNAFIPENNMYNISDFEDFIFLILKNDFSGASNLNIFNEYLKENNIVINKITENMLNYKNKVKIADFIISIVRLS